MKRASLTCSFINPGRSCFIYSCCLVITLPGSHSFAAPQHKLCVGWRQTRVAQHAAVSPRCPISAMSAPTLPVQASPALVRAQAELWQSLWGFRQQHLAEFVVALLPLCPTSGCSSTAEESYVQWRRCLLPPFFCFKPLVLFPCQWSGGSVLRHPQ